MSIITNLPAVPSRLLSIYGAVAEVENGLARDKLETWATPSSLLTRGGDEENEKSTALFTSSLSEARRLGLVEEVGGVLLVPESARKKGGRNADIETHFISYLRAVLFNPASAASTGQTSFLYALSWFLKKSPLEPDQFSDDPKELLRRDMGELLDDFSKKSELTSPTRFQNFLHWARFLGFATFIGNPNEKRAVIADPSRAISAVIDDVLPDKHWLDVGVLIERLAEIYPVLEEGVIREEEEAMRTVSQSSDSSLSQSLSFALQRLADRKIIELHVLDDAPNARILDFGANTKRVSRVRRGTIA